MAKKISLVIYGLSVLDENNNRIILNNVSDGRSLLVIVKEYAERHMKKYVNDPSKEVLFIFDKIEKQIINNAEGQKEFEVLFGRVKTGEYGIESELVDIRTGDVYNKTREQADMMPFGFCIAVPEGDVDSAVIILQTMGNFGMKISLQKHLQRCLTNINPKFRISFKTIAPKAYIDRYFNNGVLQKIRLIRYEIPEDVSNRIGINYGVKQTKEERIIHKPLGFLEMNQKKFQEWRTGQRSYTDIVEVDGYEYDDLKLEFKLGNTNKTFNLRDMDSLVVNEDITSEVTQTGGHPVFASMTPIMKRIAREYLIGMGLIVE